MIFAVDIIFTVSKENRETEYLSYDPGWNRDPKQKQIKMRRRNNLEKRNSNRIRSEKLGTRAFKV